MTTAATVGEVAEETGVMGTAAGAAEETAAGATAAAAGVEEEAGAEEAGAAASVMAAGLAGLGAPAPGALAEAELALWGIRTKWGRVVDAPSVAVYNKETCV